MSSILRTIARSRAKRNMKRKGMTRICSRNGKRGNSYFATYWKTFV